MFIKKENISNQITRSTPHRQQFKIRNKVVVSFHFRIYVIHSLLFNIQNTLILVIFQKIKWIYTIHSVIFTVITIQFQKKIEICIVKKKKYILVK